MALNYCLIVFSALLLASCAQVGTLTGGEKDVYAPAPSSIDPAQGIVNYSGNNIVFTFKEFVLLNNALQNIFIVPADVKPIATLSKKTLTVSWGDSLKPNTTYVLYLNNAVKDLSEGNDSLMTFVFSTGPIIDSLTYQTKVINTLTNEPVINCFVGLYKNESDKRPYYFARTDNFGEANFLYLKAGTYFVKAFKDDDKNMEILQNESLAFRSQLLHIDSSKIDSIPLRLFTPASKKIRSFSYQAPGCFVVGSDFDLTSSKLTLNGTKINTTNSRFISTDSLIIFTKIDSISSFQLIAEHAFSTDTLSLRLSARDKIVPLKIISGKLDNAYGPHQTVTFKLNDQISSIDTNMISVYNTKDTSIVKLDSITFKFNELYFHFNRAELKQIKIDFKAKSIIGYNASLNALSTHLLVLKQVKDYGVIDLILNGFDTNLLVDLYLGKEKVHRISTKENHYRFENLIPGDYSFVVIDDENNNGRWDTGDFPSALQPEHVYRFSSTSKVRANWEIEVELNAND